MVDRPYRLDACRVEAIATRLETITLRLEAIALRLDACCGLLSGLKPKPAFGPLLRPNQLRAWQACRKSMHSREMGRGLASLFLIANIVSNSFLLLLVRHLLLEAMHLFLVASCYSHLFHGYINPSRQLLLT